MVFNWTTGQRFFSISNPSSEFFLLIIKSLILLKYKKTFCKSFEFATEISILCTSSPIHSVWHSLYAPTQECLFIAPTAVSLQGFELLLLFNDRTSDELMLKLVLVVHFCNCCWGCHKSILISHFAFQLILFFSHVWFIFALLTLRLHWVGRLVGWLCQRIKPQGTPSSATIATFQSTASTRVEQSRAAAESIGLYQMAIHLRVMSRSSSANHWESTRFHLRAHL